jgi:DNA-binding response OmpR family regulator
MLLQNKTVLIVEDEFLIAELLEDMLVELGWASFERATSVSKALEVLSNIIPDLAIVDLNLDGQSSLPVAEALRARNIPFVFSSGYGSGSVPPEWRARPLAAKPFSPAELRAKIDEALAAG